MKRAAKAKPAKMQQPECADFEGVMNALDEAAAVARLLADRLGDGMHKDTDACAAAGLIERTLRSCIARLDGDA